MLKVETLGNGAHGSGAESFEARIVFSSPGGPHAGSVVAVAMVGKAHGSHMDARVLVSSGSRLGLTGKTR